MSSPVKRRYTVILEVGSAGQLECRYVKAISRGMAICAAIDQFEADHEIAEGESQVLAKLVFYGFVQEVEP